MARQSRYQIGLGLGLLIAALLIVYGGYRLLQMERPRQEAQAPAPAETSTRNYTVLVASRAIGRGEQITAASLRPLTIGEPPPADAAQNADGVVGRVAVTDIPANQIILNGLVTTDPARAGLAALIPPGYRAVAIRITDEIAVGNFIRPGDFVDIQVVLRENVLPRQTDREQETEGNPSEARTLLQNVKVLTVGDLLTEQPQQSTVQAATGQAGQGGQAARAEQFRHVTLAMTPEQVNELTLSRGLGTYFLALRNVRDPMPVELQTVRLDDIRGFSGEGQGQPARVEMIVGRESRMIRVTKSAGETQ